MGSNALCTKDIEGKEYIKYLIDSLIYSTYNLVSRDAQSFVYTFS